VSLTTDEVRIAFVNSGYVVSDVTMGNWLSPSVSSLRVFDGQPRSDRVLMVLVYEDTAGSLAGLVGALARDASDSPRSVTLASGPVRGG
jgi:hypothetical protein